MSQKQQELAEKIARLKASKGKQVKGNTNNSNNKDDFSTHQNTNQKVSGKPAPVKNMKTVKNISSGRKG